MSQAIAVIVPIAAGEAAPPGIFFERVLSAESPVSLIVAADSEISSDVSDAFMRAGGRVHLSPAPRGQRLREAALFTLEESPRGARLASATGLSLSKNLLPLPPLLPLQQK